MVVTMEQAEQQFASRMVLVQSGKTILIEKEGKTVGQIAPPVEGKRVFGSLEGHGIVPDDIKAPFESEINHMFYGE